MRAALAVLLTTALISTAAVSTATVALASDKSDKVAMLPADDAVTGLSRSIATPLLKTKTQYRILKHDDGQDATCSKKSFHSAEIITDPQEVGGGQTKWQEQWVLNRCGTKVGYRVFFTDVGDGGAFFAFRQTN